MLERENVTQHEKEAGLSKSQSGETKQSRQMVWTTDCVRVWRQTERLVCRASMRRRDRTGGLHYDVRVWRQIQRLA